MWIDRRQALAVLCAAVSPLAISRTARADFDGPVVRALEGGEDFWLAQDAYIYGYPLVTMEMTRRVMTNIATVGPPVRKVTSS
ncbi:hypothetical protein [Bradyrhizobium uaiense]|uniref:hypothetical protein n=1 Tax=Bradyrhizobium uaiense TaxID=2594946 RepID=UPI003D315ABB